MVGQVSKFSQNYIHQNIDAQLDTRMTIYSGMNRVMLRELQSILHSINPFDQHFKSAGEATTDWALVPLFCAKPLASEHYAYLRWHCAVLVACSALQLHFASTLVLGNILLIFLRHCGILCNHEAKSHLPVNIQNNTNTGCTTYCRRLNWLHSQSCNTEAISFGNAASLLSTH